MKIFEEIDGFELPNNIKKTIKEIAELEEKKQKTLNTFEFSAIESIIKIKNIKLEEMAREFLKEQEEQSRRVHKNQNLYTGKELLPAGQTFESTMLDIRVEERNGFFKLFPPYRTTSLLYDYKFQTFEYYGFAVIQITKENITEMEEVFQERGAYEEVDRHRYKILERCNTQSKSKKPVIGDLGIFVLRKSYDERFGGDEMFGGKVLERNKLFFRRFLSEEDFLKEKEYIAHKIYFEYGFSSKIKKLCYGLGYERDFVDYCLENNSCCDEVYFALKNKTMGYHRLMAFYNLKRVINLFFES